MEVGKTSNGCVLIYVMRFFYLVVSEVSAMSFIFLFVSFHTNYHTVLVHYHAQLSIFIFKKIFLFVLYSTIGKYSSLYMNVYDSLHRTYERRR